MDTNINEVLRSYKQRLIQANSRNSSYFVSTLRDSKLIDLYNFNDEFGDSDYGQNLLQYKSIVLHAKKFDSEQLISILKNKEDDYQEKVKEIIPYFYKVDFEYYEKQYEKELTDFELEKIIFNLIDKYDQISNRRFKSFKKLLKSSNNMIRDYGKNDLYLGFPFIEGRFDNGKYFRAPLVLHRVNITESRNKITIKLLSSDSIINPVFLMAFFIENNLEHQRIQWDIESKDYISEAIERVTQIGVNITEINTEFREISSISKDDYFSKTNMLRNDFKINYYSIIGLFPLSSRNIYNDLEELEEKNIQRDHSVGEFILGESNYDLDDIFGVKEIHRPTEEEILYITQLDFSQKNVLKKSLDDNLVIEGPPGTGKSQTIVNIIVNNLYQDKKVLVVSEKVAAINVLYNRLGNLRNNTLFIKNHITDKLDFYKQLKTTIEHFITKNDIYNLTSLNKKIEDHLDYIEVLNQFKNHKGYSYDDLFALEKLVDTKAEKYYQSFEKYGEKRFLGEIDFTKKDVTKYLEKLFTKSNFTIFGKLDRQLQLKVYNDIDLYKIKKLNEIQDEYKNDNLIKYAYYLLCEDRYKDFHVEDKLTFSFPMKKMSIIQLNNFIKKSVNKYKKFDEEITEINSDYYIDEVMTLPIMNYIKMHNEFTNKERLIEFKKAVDPEFEYGFINKLFHKKIKLSNEEQELFAFINKHIKLFQVSTAIKVLTELTDSEITLFKYINESEELTNEELFLVLLYSDFCTLNIKNYQKRINTYFDAYEDINFMDYERGIDNFDSADLELFKELVKADYDLETVKQYIHLGYLGRSRLLKVVDAFAYFEDYDYHYDVVNRTVNKKIDVSRLLLEQTVIKNVRQRFNDDVSLIKGISDLKKQIELKRKKSAKVISTKYFDVLKTLYPVWLMTPESASALLPLEPNLFDVVIFDEASQMFVEKAVPSIYRSNRIIVAGDSQQLRPSSVFSQRFTEGEEVEDDLSLDFEIISSLTSESLLDHAKTKFKSDMLEYHYRSEHKELIDFSSNAFYDGRLVFASKCFSEYDRPIETVFVDKGLWINNKNVEEARECVNLVKEILDTRKNNETIGIITFNSIQMELIEDMLSDCDSRKVQKELVRYNQETEEDESLFIKNIENVQGDERDIIIFSVGYGKNEKGKIYNKFGSLDQENGENRLNVAITRAKKKVYIVKSLYANELHVNEYNRGAFLFKKYLQYAEYLNEDKPEMVEGLLNQLCDIHDEYDNNTIFDSSFEREVYTLLNEKLDQLKYELHTKVKVGSFDIDLGVFDKMNKKYVLGIECDAITYNTLESPIERDYYRQLYLESRTWSIERIWSTNWWKNKELEIERIMNRIVNNCKMS